jgi:hypothetical protein
MGTYTIHQSIVEPNMQSLHNKTLKNQGTTWNTNRGQMAVWVGSWNGKIHILYHLIISYDIWIITMGLCQAFQINSQGIPRAPLCTFPMLRKDQSFTSPGPGDRGA